MGDLEEKRSSEEKMVVSESEGENRRCFGDIVGCGSSRFFGVKIWSCFGSFGGVFGWYGLVWEETWRALR